MSNNFGLTTFDSSGKLTQLDNAFKAVSNGHTSLGIACKNGVVIATEKKASSILLDESDWRKVFQFSQCAGCVYSGLGGDARLLARKARKSGEVYRVQYDEEMPVREISKKLGETCQDATQSGGVRPFGVSLLVAGYDKVKGPQLYQVDPSGTYWAWKASAIGRSQTSAKQFLEKRYSDDLELEDAIHVALLTLKDSFDGDVNSKNIELGVVRRDIRTLKWGFKVLSSGEVADYLTQFGVK